MENNEKGFYMKQSFVSFDVFDTCLIRRCGRPYKIWDLMADRLFEKDDSRGRLSFTGNRSLAEKKTSYGSPYPTLNDIYQELNVAQWGFEQNSIMILEMEIEEQELFPNPEMLKTVNQYRENGFKIAFVSDMYLPPEFIRKVLAKFGFCKDDDLVFVSAFCKASKNDGKLFDFVLRETQTKAKQWIHYGDNERSDYRIPKSRGIKAYLVNDTDFTDEEKRWIDDARFYSRKHEIELWAGLCRLTRLQNERSFAATMAVDFIASVYVPYVAYVLRTAKEKGIKTLYFLARDGHIFLEIAKAMKAESEGIECRYLKVSRRALYSCAFYEVNDFELSVTVGVSNFYGPIKNVMNQIGVEYDELSEKTKSLFRSDEILRDEKRNILFQQTLKENDSALLLNSAKQNRKCFLEYLKQECVFDAESAMVDLGWIGSCRTILNYILSKENKRTVSTFYWGYYSSLLYGQKYDELFVFNRQFDNVEEYSCANNFFEKYASLNANGSTLRYEQKGEKSLPVEGLGDGSLISLMNLNELAVVSLVRNYIERRMDLSDIFLCCGLKQELQILRNPSTEHLNLFEVIRFENYDIETKMVRSLPLKDVLALLVWGVPASMIWTEAAVKKRFGPFAPIFVKVYKFSSKTWLARKLQVWWEKK